MTKEGAGLSRSNRSEDRRRHLLDTAQKLFAEKGFHQTGVAQIASASGIKVGQIYRDFANKEAIIAAICDARFADWFEEDTLSAALAANDRAAIRKWLQRFIDHGSDPGDRRLLAEVLAEVSRNSLIAEGNYRREELARKNIMAALRSLAPEASDDCRNRLIDLMFVISWGTIAWMELRNGPQDSAVHKYFAALLEYEIDRMGEGATGLSSSVVDQMGSAIPQMQTVDD